MRRATREYRPPPNRIPAFLVTARTNSSTAAQLPAHSRERLPPRPVV